MRVQLHKTFEKEFVKRSVREQQAFRKRLALFLKEPFHPSLRNHPLEGQYLGCSNINIKGDLRALYRIADPNTVLFLRIGTHSQLYR